MKRQVLERRPTPGMHPAVARNSDRPQVSRKRWGRGNRVEEFTAKTRPPGFVPRTALVNPASHQVGPPTQQITRRIASRRIDQGLRPQPPRKRLAILCESILSFLAFPPWMAFIASACPSTNARPSAAHISASLYHVHMHSAATTRSSRYGAPVSSKASGVDFTLRCTST